MPLCHNAAKVGALLFATAQSIYECTEDVRPAVGDACPSQACVTASNSFGEEGRKEVELSKASSYDADENRLEEIYRFDPPKCFETAPSFPDNLILQFRSMPHEEGELISCVPGVQRGATIVATGQVGQYLQTQVEPQKQASERYVWVPRVLDGLVLFLEKSDPAKVDKEAEAEHPAGSTEEAILEQQDQVQRFQSWWAEGKGMVGARSHPMLSILDATVLGDIIAAGANYHNCLSADRLDALQRHVSKSSASGLDALRRALQAKGGAKSQARAVGSVIFKEAMDMFKHPPSDMNRSSPALSASPGESQGEQSGAPNTPLEQARPNACVVADEIFDPPKRFVCSESFPPEATVAVRLEPNKASSLVTSLPYGSDVLATAARGTYLQFKLEKSQEHGDIQHVWVPRVLDGLVLFVEKSDPAKVDKEAEAEHPAGSTEEAILEQQDQVQRFQSWWAEGKGMVGARSHPMLSILDATVLGDIIAAGANYHNCLSADRLDALQRHVSKSSASGLDALRRALQAKGGAKSQARAVGSVIFKEAMDMFKHPPSDMNRSSPALAASAGESQGEQSGAPNTPLEQARPNACVVADEIFDPPKRFVCSESFPPEATVAVRLEPNKASSLVTSLPYGSDVLATAARGTYLQFKLEKSQEHGDIQHVWVPRVLDGLVLFVEKSDPAKVDKEAEAEHPAGSTEEAILEQQDHVQRFQSWWAEGKGMVGARSHPMLSILDATVLGDIIAAGANYHNCLSADRLDALQRHVSKSSASGLDALRRALQAKGGAKSQARAVGSVIFKEAMDMFKHPPSDMNRSSPALAASPGESQGEQSGAPNTPLEQARPNACVVADEIFDPPKRFVCSESFPPEATVAVRLEPNKASSLVTSLPYGSDVLATAARGTYLQFKLEKSQEHGDIQHVWVPRVLDGLVLFVEKSDPAKVDKEAEAEHPAGSTEEAILEQQDQVQRFQSWWAEGKGMVGARSHPMLSILDATVLGDIIAAGANYHNCLSADRLDALQRHVSKSSASGLDALRRALQAKGGAKSQARAVGSVIFKEAMDMFKHPPSDMNRSSPALAASAGESQGEQSGAPNTPLEQARPNACVVADEIFDPPKRFVCSESFPPEATVAVRSAPSHQSEYLACLPHGTVSWLQLSNRSMCTLSCFFRGEPVRLTIR